MQLHKKHKTVSIDNGKDTLKISYGFDTEFAEKHNQKPYFSITGNIRGCAGMIHDVISLYAPELKPLFKWHLTSYPLGPMYYVANAVYWFEKGLGLSPYDRKSYDTDSFNAFCSTVVFGAIPNDRLPEFTLDNGAGYDRISSRLITPKEARKMVEEYITEWCNARFDKLMAAFKTDMINYGLIEE